jgi:hypothetical protein
MRLAILTILLVPFMAFAKEPILIDKKVVCLKTTEMFASIQSKYGEFPIWHGDADEGSIVITANRITNTWSIIQYNEKVACLLAVGEKFQFRDSHKLKL